MLQSTLLHIYAVTPDISKLFLKMQLKHIKRNDEVILPQVSPQLRLKTEPLAGAFRHKHSRHLRWKDPQLRHRELSLSFVKLIMSSLSSKKSRSKSQKEKVRHINSSLFQQMICNSINSPNRISDGSTCVTFKQVQI